MNTTDFAGVRFVELTTPESLTAVRKIADEIWPETFSAILSQEQIVYMMKMMYAPEVMADELARGYHFILLQINNEDAGYISWSPYGGAGTVKLHKLYLRSKFHGAGIGTLMLKHIISLCRSQCCSRLLLNVNKNNEKAIKAYKRNGFAVLEAVCNDIGNGFVMDDYVMYIDLAE